MEETINYRGHDIRKRSWKISVEPYRTIDSNQFDLTEEDIKTMLDNLSKKKADLESDHVEFKNLRYKFDVCEDHSYDDYYPHDAECEICLVYDRPETDQEAKDRISGDKEYIDRIIEEEIRSSKIEEMINQHDIEEAIRLLRDKGYSVSKK